jgi:choice-of-anchor B domain-containing protein
MKISRTIYVIVAFVGLCISTSSVSGQRNLRLLSTYNVLNQSLSGCWHYTDSAFNEYALIGAEQGIVFLDITQPTNPVYLFQLPGNRSIWHEVKVRGNYAYAVSEGSDTNGIKNGVQIMDLRYLPDSVPFKFWQGDGAIANQLLTAHTVTIDGDYLYINGHNINSLGKGVLICSLADPWNPTYVGAVTGNYSHDSYVRSNRLYSSEIFAGQFSVYDITNKANPVLLATQATPSRFNHNTWLSDNGQVIFTTDERGGAPVAAYDISDLSNITKLDEFKNINLPQSEVHNVRVIFDFVINPSYGSQLTIADASRPHNIVEVASYPTGPSLCWDADPYLNSGAILATDMTSHNVYLLEPTYKRACYLEGIVTDSITGAPLPGVSLAINATAGVKLTNADGSYATGIVDTGTYSVTYSKLNYRTKTISGLSLQTSTVTLQNVELAPENISVPELNLNSFIQYGPNPTSGFIDITNLIGRQISLQLIDIHGRLVKTIHLQGDQGQVERVLLNDIAPGIYHLQFLTEKGKATEKIVVN